MSRAPLTFFWHDYETFGTVARRDRPAQFAGVRTDADLREIGEPLSLYCHPPDDRLPDPESCLLTGIVPQYCAQHGVPEHQFAASIERELSLPGTVGVGYNSIGFDDEVTRFLFWRNLIEPYAREWQNDCGRWDLLDTVRRAIQRATALTTNDLKKGIPALATIGATAPFVGLLGTVVGVINAFTGIAATGSGGLGAVSAGIAEALVETALGLVVAIPAVWIYNYFTTRLEYFNVEMDNSSSELVDYFIKKTSN